MSAIEEIGRELKRRREELGKSLEDAQTVTKIRMRYLKALEQGDTAIIPGEVYVKGFLRAYAEYLGMDGWEQVERYREWSRRQRGQNGDGELEDEPGGAAVSTPAEPEVNVDPRLSAGPDQRRRRRMVFSQSQGNPGGFGIILRAAFILLLVLVGYLLWLGMRGQNIGSVPEPAELPVPSADAPAQPQDTGTDPKEVRTEDEPPVGGEDTVSPITEADDTPVKVERTQLPGTSNERFQFLVTGADRIEAKVELAGSCWFEVVVDDRPVFEGTLMTGAVRTWSAEKELYIRAGLAGNVNLTVNGVAMERFDNSDVVDIIIKIAP